MYKVAITNASTMKRRNSPRSGQTSEVGLLGQALYKSRRTASQIKTTDLPYEIGAIGYFSPWAVLWIFLFSVAPFAYIYILLMLLRDLCIYFPESFQQPLQMYFPLLARLANLMNSSSKITEIWCVIEAIFYVTIKLQVYYLQTRDPLEASLSAAPMLDPVDRKKLWDRMVDAEKDDPVTFLSGWFFDQPIENISRYDVFDFICWSMFDGRNQEHLTLEEEKNLEEFVDEMELVISLHLYGAADDEDDEIKDNNGSGASSSSDDRKEEDSVSDVISELTNENDENTYRHNKNPTNLQTDKPLVQKGGNRSVPDSNNSNDSKPEPAETEVAARKKYARPKKMFRFSVEAQHVQSNFFSNLYESYKNRYEKYRNMVERAQFHPVQDFRNMIAETAQQAEDTAQDFRNMIAETAQQAEDSAMATATSMYETIVQPGSHMDKQLSALSHATSMQLSEAWNSVKGMRERLETAQFLSNQRERLIQQLRGNRAMLTRMRAMSYAVPSKQMAALMRKITECNDALERTEASARDAFARATGILPDGSKLMNIFNGTRKEPQRYAKYSSDPLLGISTFPLGFHLLVLGCTEIPLRVMMKNRGFERRFIGPIAYYYHPGGVEDNASSSIGDDDGETKRVPIVFVHGIGVGLIMYMQFIDALLHQARPLLLPEIPYVSGFRQWQSPSSVLSPAVVASTMTAMLATHGFSRGTFAGHSYGTSWLSYMCKYAPSAVGALLFLDPICFSLHTPKITKNFVYHRPDPGTVSFMVRTDIIVNWTIQRAFPWTWIALFVEQISVPCTIFLSDKDALVPAVEVEQYLRSKDIPVCDAAAANKDYFENAKGHINACVFRGHIHGGWTEQPRDTVPKIEEACSVLCRKADD